MFPKKREHFVDIGPRNDSFGSDKGGTMKDEAYQQRAREFAKTRPDFNDVLNSASARGLNLSDDSLAEIRQLPAPDVVYYLALPENEGLAREINGLTGQDARRRIQFLRDRLERQNTFSPAPVRTVPSTNADGYLRQRREDIREGKRGRG